LFYNISNIILFQNLKYILNPFSFLADGKAVMIELINKLFIYNIITNLVNKPFNIFFVSQIVL